MIDLSGRVAIVTGASRGIGRAVALRLAAQGASVIAAARAEHARSTADEIAAAGGRAEAMTLDVTDAAAVDAAVLGTTDRHGRIDILVNNAGITRDQLMLRLKRDGAPTGDVAARTGLHEGSVRRILNAVWQRLARRRDADAFFATPRFLPRSSVRKTTMRSASE